MLNRKVARTFARSSRRSNRGTPSCVPRRVSTSTLRAISANARACQQALGGRLEQGTSLDYVAAVGIDSPEQRRGHGGIGPPLQLGHGRVDLGQAIADVLVAAAVEIDRRGFDDAAATCRLGVLREVG